MGCGARAARPVRAGCSPMIADASLFVRLRSDSESRTLEREGDGGRTGCAYTPPGVLTTVLSGLSGVLLDALSESSCPGRCGIA